MPSRVAVVGGGLARFGAREATWRELVQEAGKAVFDSLPDLHAKDVDSLFVGAAEPERFAFQSYVAPLVAEQLGIRPKTIMRTELACASGQSAMRAAYAHIVAGMTDVALVLGCEKMNLPNMAEAQAAMACVLDREWDGVMGGSAPPFFAMCAQRHMKEFGTTREQLALVSEKNHAFSVHNPYAQFQKPVPREKVLNSPMVAPPLRLYDCSGITDGAAATVLVSAERAKQFTDTPLYVLGWGQNAHGHRVGDLGDLARWPALRVAAQEAYRNARVGPADIDVAEVHDCFTISEIMNYEGLGFCPEGQGGRFIEEGQSHLGGKVTVNPRGGLLGCGHPLGATGIAQAVELLWQFQAKVPPQRLVQDAEIALAHNLSGPANVHSIGIYGRSANATGA